MAVVRKIGSGIVLLGAVLVVFFGCIFIFGGMAVQKVKIKLKLQQ